LDVRSDDAGKALIHIHEDDWGLRTLHPLAARHEVAQDMDVSREAGERNCAPSGKGWTAVHVIRPASEDYSQTGLTPAAVAVVLEPIMPRVKRFYATATSGFSLKPGEDPYGYYNEDAWCFGRGPHCYIKLDVKEGFVCGIWFDLYGSSPADAAALRLSLEAIDRLVPSFVADYVLDAEGPVANAEFLSAYCKRLMGDEE